MKKLILFVLAAAMTLALAACGGQSPAAPAPAPSQTTPTQTTPAEPSPAPATTPGEPSHAPAAPDTPAPAADGTIALTMSQIALQVGETAVPMPYTLPTLADAGVPVDPYYLTLEVGSGEFFSLNIYLDENEDYVIVPDYYNGGDAAVSMSEAEAEEITISSFASAPEDQGVSLLGVGFGMAKSAVLELLGQPMWEDDTYCEWTVTVSDAPYEGSFTVYFTSDAADAVVSQADLSVIEQ